MADLPIPAEQPQAPTPLPRNMEALDALGRTLTTRFQDYARDRRLAELKWLQNARQFLGVHDPETEAMLAASGIPDVGRLLDYTKAVSPMRDNVTQTDVAYTAAFLASDGARMITGQTLYVDGGYSIIGVPGEIPQAKA